MRQKLSFIISLLCLSLLTVPAFADDLGAFKGQSGTIKIAGGTAHISVMKQAAQNIMSEYPDIRISIAGGGSGVGIKKVGEGMIDIGNAGRKATDKEVSTYGLKMYKWAIDGVAIVVNPKNSVQSLSSKDLAAIYAGKITNWKELGGVDRAINLYTRDEASGTRAVFWKKALKKGELAKTANVVVSNGAMKTFIANDPFAIGYVSVGHVNDSVAPVALDGVAPSLKNVQNGDYKVSRGLYSLTKGEATGLSKIFIDYIFSPSGQKIVQSKGFIAVK